MVNTPEIDTNSLNTLANVIKEYKEDKTINIIKFLKGTSSFKETNIKFSPKSTLNSINNNNTKNQ